MSEHDFKKLKQWFWTFLLGQLFIILLSGALFIGGVRETIGQNTEDIKELKAAKVDYSLFKQYIKENEEDHKDIKLDIKAVNDGQIIIQADIKSLLKRK